MWMALRLLALGVAFLFGMQAALAGARVALVIGNGSYEGTTKLANPVNDASDIAAKLKQLGFTVVEGYDLGKRQMEEKIGEFSDRLEGADAGVLYYAGHGIAVAGRNYIVPVDAHLDAPARLKFESISIDDVAELMRGQTEVSVLVLDACRNNPFARTQTLAARGATEASGGLAAAQSYAGAYTVYSAQDGAVALDGKGRNSPFAVALLRHLDMPGASVEVVMGQVKADVEEATKGFQSPDAKGLLIRPFSFSPLEQQATRSVEPEKKVVAPTKIADQAALRTFVETEYLDPDVDHLEATLRRMYTGTVTSFGYVLSFEELLQGKRNYFNQFSKWKLSLTPGSLFIDFTARDAAKVTFILHYAYWKKGSDTPAEGDYKAALDMVRQSDGLWRIQSEAAAQ